MHELIVVTSSQDKFKAERMVFKIYLCSKTTYNIKLMLLFRNIKYKRDS